MVDYSRHVEAPEFGGAAYLRCSECGAEVVGRDPENMIHRKGCTERTL